MKEPKIIHHEFPTNQYKDEETDKHQIVLHHTVSGKGVSGDINWWEQTKVQVATCVIIARDGTIHTLFTSKKWAHHLGIKNYILKQHGLPYYKKSSDKLTWNQWLNKHSLGVELDSWGGLTERGGRYYTDKGTEVLSDDVVSYNHSIRGYKHYEKYTPEQIHSLEYLLRYWNTEYGIPIKYNPSMWELSMDALNGKPGLYTHTSYRPDKSDCHPQEELITMLKTL